MARLFISHSSANNDKAVEVRDWLAKNGWDDVFLDLDPERGIVAGQRWKEALQKAAYRCEVVLALVSKEWLASSWCKSEIDAARLMGKKAIAALVNVDKSAVPVDLTDEQFIDLASDPQAFRRLKEGLKRAGLDPTTFPFPAGRRPYPGFAYLEEEDAAVFFGRDAQIVRGLDEIRRLARAGVTRMLVILGASGSGKSSFLRAGLWARVKRDDRAWLTLPIVRPERAAISGKYGLAEALYEIVSDPRFADAMGKRGLPRSRIDIQDLIEKTDDGLAKLLAALREIAQSSLPGDDAAPPTVLLAIDQGEELFNEEGREEAKRLIDILPKTLAADPHVMAMLVMRSDAFPLVQNDPALAALPKDTFTLDMMLEGSFRAVIEGPARLVEPPLAIDPQLTDALLEDISGQDALPLLAFTLAHLYDNTRVDNALTLAGYDRIGRVKGVIDKTVAQAFAEATSRGEAPKDRQEQLKLARSAFIPHLAQVNPAGQFVRRVAPREKIPDEARPLVDRFAEQRLLIRDRRQDAEVIEVAHEALLRQPPFSDWLAEDREFLLWRDRLTQARTAFEADERGSLTGRELAIARSYLQTRAERDFEAADLKFIRDSIATDDKRRAEEAEEQRKREAAEREEQERRLRDAEQIAAEQTKAAAAQKRFAWGAVVALVIALGLAAFGGYEAYTANQNKQIAEKQAGIALSRQLATQASYQVKSDQLDLALLLSVEAARAAYTSEARSALFTSLQTRPQLLQYVRARGSSIEGLAADALGKYALLGTSDGGLILWDIENRAQTMEWRSENPGSIRAVAFDKAGHSAVLVTDAGRISVWSLSAQPKRLSEFSIPAVSRVPVVALSPDGKIVAAGADGSVSLWNSGSGELLDGGLVGEMGEIYALTFDPEGKTLAAAYDHKVVLWEVASRKRIEPALSGHPLTVNSLAYSPDGKLLASASINRIFLWDALTHQQLGNLGDPGEDNAVSVVRALHFVDNAQLISAGDGGAITRWSVFHQRLGEEPVVERIGSGGIDQIAALSGGIAMALRSSGRVILWDLSSGRSLGHRLNGYEHDVAVSSLALDGVGRHLAVGGEGASILWDTVDHKQIGPTLVHSGDRADSIALSPDGRMLAVGTCAAHEVSPVERHQGKSCSKGKIMIWTLVPGATGAPSMITGHGSQVTRLAFSPEGTTLASASWDNTVMLWSVEDGRQLGPPVQADAVLDLAFAFDGNDFLVRSIGGIVRRGKLTRDGLEPGALTRLDDPERGYPLGLLPLASSRQGDTWALDQPKSDSVVLWDKSTGRELGPELTGHTHSVATAAFSADGRLLATTDGQEIILWDLNPDTWEEQACLVASRNLRWDEWLQFFPDRPYRKTCDRLPVPYSVIKGTFDDTRGLLPEGQSKFAIAMAWAEEIGSPEVFNEVCSEESLAGMAKMAAPFCERAVALAPSRGDIRDSRGLSRALTGNSRGAMDDFLFFAKWKRENSEGDWSESWKKREEWVARLEKGENPFDPKTLAEMRSAAAFTPAE